MCCFTFFWVLLSFFLLLILFYLTLSDEETLRSLSWSDKSGQGRVHTVLRWLGVLFVVVVLCTLLTILVDVTSSTLRGWLI